MPVIRDTTDGAPVLSGTVGSLIAVLDFCLVTNSGWTKPYSGLNLAAYQMPSGSSGRFLRVDDTNAQNARLRLYESMSDITAGAVGPAPTDAQVNGGLFAFKSTVAGVVARPWLFVAYGNMAYLFVAADGVATNYACYAFGDPLSYRSGDQFQAVLIANAVGSAGTTNIAMVNLSGPGPAVLAGHYMARSYTQLGGAVQVGKICDSQYMTVGSMLGLMTYPSPIDSGLHLRPCWLVEGVLGRRALLPGLWVPEHAPASLNSNDTFTGVVGTDMAGRTFEWMRIGTSYACCIETSNTWGL